MVFVILNLTVLLWGLKQASHALCIGCHIYGLQKWKLQIKLQMQTNIRSLSACGLSKKRVWYIIIGYNIYFRDKMNITFQ